MLVETLRADWTARGANTRVSALPTFEDGELLLGATKITGAGNEAAAAGRAVALAAVAIGRPLDPSAATHVRRALAKAREGDAPLALTHLALAGVGRLDDPREDARRLFIADRLMEAGVPPRTVLEALGAGPASADLERAYNPSQPRVPPGNGKPSGQWASGEEAGGTVGHRAEGTAGVRAVQAPSARRQEVRFDTAPTSAVAPTSAAAPAPEAPSLQQSLLTSFVNAVPGAYYGHLAAQAVHRGEYYQAGLYEAAALLEAALETAAAVVTDGESVTAHVVEGNATRVAAQLAVNKLAGQAFEDAVWQKLLADGLEVGQQITLVTVSGVRTRVDFLTRDSLTGEIAVVESKASSTAPLTSNQERAFPEIEESGATIVGAGKPGFPGGMRIPPTKIRIIRKP